MAIPVILKGDTAREIKLVLSDGYEYDGCTLHAQLGIATRSFSGLHPGDTVTVDFSAEETATFPLGTSKLHLSLQNAIGAVRTLPWAKVKVTDSPGEVYGAEIEIDPGSLNVDDLTAKDTLGGVKSRLQAVINFLRGLQGGALALAVSCALTASAAVPPAYSSLDDIPGTASILTNAAEYAEDQAATALADAKAYTDAAVADIPEVDMSAVTNIAQEAATAAQERAVADAADYTDRATNGLLRAESDPTVPNWAKAASAPLPPDYAAVSNAAKSAVQTETDPEFTTWADAHVVAGGSMVDWSLDSMYAQYLGDAFAHPNYTAADITAISNALKTAIAGKLGNIGDQTLAEGSLAVTERNKNGSHRQVSVTADGISFMDEMQIGGSTMVYSKGGISKTAGGGQGYTYSFPSASGTVALTSDIPDIPAVDLTPATNYTDAASAAQSAALASTSNALAAAIAAIPAIDLTDATNYTDEVAGDLSTAIAGKYAKASGDQLAQQVSAIGAHLNGEDAKVIVTNYNSSTHLPEAEFDINVSNNWLVVWREMTRWNWFLGDVFDPHTNAVARALANKAEKEYAFFDGVTGEPAPDGFFWISQPRVAICAGAAYQRYVDAAGEVWVLESNGMVADINGTTNGYFRISDDKGNVQFEIVKGDSRTVTAAAGAMTRSSVMGVTHWHTTYMVTNVVSAPKAMFCRDIANPEWYAEDDAGCPCNVDWTHPSEGIYVCEWWPQGDEPKMFMRSQYGQGSESRIIQTAPVEMQYIVIGGTKYALGTATIDGKTVLTLSTP